MNRLFAFLAVLVLCIVGIGFYQGWFTVTTPISDTESNKLNVGVTVDPDKVKADAAKVKEKAMELTGQAAKGAKELVDPATDKVNADEK